MSMLSSLLGLDYKAPAQTTSENNLLASLQDPNYGQDQVAKSTAAATQAALPSYLQNMQGLKEDNIRRGISTGDLGTSFEGDLTSAFQRNIASSAASQSASMFDSRTNLLAGLSEDQLNREQAAQNGAAQRKSGFINGLIGNAGSIGSGLVKAGGFLAGLL